jgi:hypothetical protein
MGIRSNLNKDSCKMVSEANPYESPQVEEIRGTCPTCLKSGRFEALASINFVLCVFVTGLFVALQVLTQYCHVEELSPFMCGIYIGTMITSGLLFITSIVVDSEYDRKP